MDDETYLKNQLKRRARTIQKETGMKYTEALRQAKEELANALQNSDN